MDRRDEKTHYQDFSMTDSYVLTYFSVLVMFPTSTFLYRRELRQIRRICGKWKSDKCDTSWEQLNLSKKAICCHKAVTNFHTNEFAESASWIILSTFWGNNWSIVWFKQSVSLLWLSLRIYPSYIAIQQSDCFGDWLSKMNHSAVLLPREISTFW